MEQDQLLEDGELMIHKVRKHWMVYVSDFMLHSIGCFMLMSIAVYLTNRDVLSFLNTSDKAAISMTLVAMVLIFWTSYFFGWTKEYFDVWYVTDRHIIAVNQKDMFEREEAFMELSRIQDVFFEKNSFLQTLLGYGKLKVQTAGAEQEFIIESVSDVEAVTHKIMELRDASQTKKMIDNI